MRAKEAIHILDHLRPADTKDSFDAYIVGEALEMAIKALEQEPCDDAISRQAVLDTIHRFFTEEVDKIPTKKTEDGEVIIICKAQPLFAMNKTLSRRIKELPSVNPQEPKWIPVSERLPEDMTYVLTTIQTNPKRVRVRSGNYYHGHFHNDNGDTWNATDMEVKAWMPLPEPYKAESENKE